MTHCDALVVGGGPGGSTCAWYLRHAGWNVLVADRDRFPRDKVCAGWLTPEVFGLLQLDPAEYRAAGLTLQEITAFRTGVLGARLVETRYGHVVSYAIRRCEFDDYLVHRSGAPVHEMTVSHLERRQGRWIVNGEIETPVVVGAGGHFCPVARHLAGGVRPPAVVAREAEVPLNDYATTVGAHRPELFFCRDLAGYAWCVRKGAYINMGIGRRGSEGFNDHMEAFMAFLARTGTVAYASEPRWRGHAYLASGAGLRPLVADGVLLVGDSAGLAYPESGEGIKPAIESGLIAAKTLAALGVGGRVDRQALRPYVARIRRLYPLPRRAPQAVRLAKVTLGRRLRGLRTFARPVVLNRWFLRA